jgi:hypothetical protein
MPKWLSKGIARADVAFTRAPALFRRMGIPPSPADPTRRGMVVIQIDGLSYPRMMKALGRRQLPFLRTLVKRGRYKPHKYYSELPTSTPAFQAGVFYGDNSNIPGFNFYDKYEKRFYRMGDSECAYSVEKSFRNPGLLRGGSVLSCVYTGGAEAAMFVFSTMLAPKRWRFVLRVWDIFMLSLLNVALLLKVLGLAFIEFFIALADALPFIFGRGWVKRELTVIGIRVGLMVVARELITAGAIVDVFRGAPVIYLTFLGYDEQAHVRGPDSPVAMWALRGIDRSIRRIYKATVYADREYDVYVLSDHGQAATQPFALLTNEPLAEYVQAQLTGVLVENYTLHDPRTSQMLRTVEALHRIVPAMPRLFHGSIRWYADYLMRRLPGPAAELDGVEALLDVSVVSTGPIAYIYWNKIDHALRFEEIEMLHPGFIDMMVEHPAISFVSVRIDDRHVLVRGPEGEVMLGPEGIVRERRGAVPLDRSVAPAHVMRGVWRVTLMPRAGDVCVWGGGCDDGNVSYGFEFGAHSGWTDDEITAFVLAPSSVTYDFSAIRSHTEFYDFFSRYMPEPQPDSEAAAMPVAG